MPRYRVVDMPTFLDNTMRQPGEIVEFSGWPGSTLVPEDDVARRIKTYFDKCKNLKTFPRKGPDMAKFADAVPVEHPKPKDEVKTDG